MLRHDLIPFLLTLEQNYMYSADFLFSLNFGDFGVVKLFQHPPVSLENYINNSQRIVFGSGKHAAVD
jgi:hypothetical protein